MTIAELLQRTISTAKVQFLHECTVNARSVAKRRSTPAHTRVEFATQNMSPNDLLYHAMDRPPERQPQYVGMVVWVPFDAYDEFTRRTLVGEINAAQAVSQRHCSLCPAAWAGNGNVPTMCPVCGAEARE